MIGAEYMATKINRAGRKRKSTVRRSSNGKSRGEPEDRVKDIVWAQRAKIMPEAWVKDELAGYTLGILNLRHRASPDDPSGITDDQREAGNRWAAIVRRHSIVMGYELKPVKAASFQRVSPTTGNETEDEARRIAKALSDFDICYDALMEVCRQHGLGVRDITYAVSVENLPVASITERGYGDLKIGLNAIARALR